MPRQAITQRRVTIMGHRPGEQLKQMEAGAPRFAAEIGLPPEDSGLLEATRLVHEIGVVRRSLG